MSMNPFRILCFSDLYSSENWSLLAFVFVYVSLAWFGLCVSCTYVCISLCPSFGGFTFVTFLWSSLGPLVSYQGLVRSRFRIAFMGGWW